MNFFVKNIKKLTYFHFICYNVSREDKSRVIRSRIILFRESLPAYLFYFIFTFSQWVTLREGFIFEIKEEQQQTE